MRDRYSLLRTELSQTTQQALTKSNALRKVRRTNVQVVEKETYERLVRPPFAYSKLFRFREYKTRNAAVRRYVTSPLFGWARRRRFCSERFLGDSFATSRSNCGRPDAAAGSCIGGFYRTYEISNDKNPGMAGQPYWTSGANEQKGTVSSSRKGL